MSIITPLLSTLIRMSGPTGSIAPAAPVSGPNSGQLITGLAGTVTGGLSAYSSMNGRKVSATMSDIGQWVGRQFAITPTPAA